MGLSLAMLLGSAPACANADAADAGHAADTDPADTDQDGVPIDSEAGIGVAAGLVSLVYTPAKVLYALGGGAVAGMAYLASAGNEDVTEPILTPSLRGDYIVTPEHLRGERPLEFFGREPGDPPAVSSGDGLDGATAAASPASDSGDASDAAGTPE
jgi:hypothetical protein